jgi:signal transduction histidine kinase/Tfp pilus assembly protein PilF
MTKDEIQTIVNQAGEAQERGNFSEAERLANEVVVYYSSTKSGVSSIKEESVGLFYSQALRILGLNAARKGDTTLALERYSAALALSENINDRVGIARASSSIGNLYRQLGDASNALEYYGKALSSYENLGEKDSVAGILGNLGLVYFGLSDYARALDYYHKALEIDEERGNTESEARHLGNIGLVYWNLSDYPRALEFYHKALELNQQIENMVAIGRWLGNIGNVYKDIADYDRALEYMQKAVEMANANGNTLGAAINLGNIGIVHQHRGEYVTALKYFEDAVALHTKLGNQMGIAFNLGNIGILHTIEQYENFDLEKAESYIRKVLEIFEQFGAKKQQYESHKTLAELFEKQERWKEHSLHFKKFYELEQEVQSEESKKQADKFAFERKVAEQEKRIAIEQARNEEIMRQKYILEAQAAKIQLANTELHEKNIELNSANFRLEEANSFKMKILGIASHDLKNPITALKLYASLLRKHTAAVPEASKMLEMITASSKRMLDIVINLIDVAARELGQIKLSRTSIDIAALSANVVSEYFPHATQKQQTIDFTFEGNCIISADTERLRQVLDNLISNAVKYSERGKEIRVSVTRSEATVRIAVADEGQGLSSEDMQLLFKDFQKLSARPTGGEGSTGLGLSVVKHLIELHGGKVWAESAGKGQGSTFYVELPA